MIHAFGQPDAPVPRLMAALAERGHAVRAADGARPAERATLVLGPGVDLEPMALGVLLGAWRTAPGARVLVLGLLGAAPRARQRRLRKSWEVEELVKGSGMPVLAMRLAPLLGPASPLWLRLRSRPRLPGGGREALNPVAEEDVVEAIDRALRDAIAWDGVHEVTGAERFTLAELADLAGSGGDPMPRHSGEWEPPLAELREQHPVESGAWCAHFGITAPPIRERAAAWLR